MIEEPGKDSGCTAVVALLNGRDLYVANAGDSRCVVCRNGKAIDMSLDHKPEDEEESARIINAGGRVTLDGRVNGGLNLSRAIGDHAYKMVHILKIIKLNNFQHKTCFCYIEFGIARRSPNDICVTGCAKTCYHNRGRIHGIGLRWHLELFI